MLVEPRAEWSVPTTDWAEVIDRYAHFQQVRSLRGKTHTAAGVRTVDRWSRADAERKGALLHRRVGEARDRGDLEPSPHSLGQDWIDRLVDGARGGPVRPRIMKQGWVDHLWRALLLNRDGYSCVYCRRTAPMLTRTVV